MSKIKLSLVLSLLASTAILAEDTKSNNLSGLQVMTDTTCSVVKEKVVKKDSIEKVETVAYVVKHCNGDAVFPVTVRKNSMIGEK